MRISIKNYEAALEIYVSLQKLNDAVEILEHELMRLVGEDINPNGNIMHHSRTGEQTLIQALKNDGYQVYKGGKRGKKS